MYIPCKHESTHWSDFTVWFAAFTDVLKLATTASKKGKGGDRCTCNASLKHLFMGAKRFLRLSLLPSRLVSITKRSTALEALRITITKEHTVCIIYRICFMDCHGNARLLQALKGGWVIHEYHPCRRCGSGTLGGWRWTSSGPVIRETERGWLDL